MSGPGRNPQASSAFGSDEDDFVQEQPRVMLKGQTERKVVSPAAQSQNFDQRSSEAHRQQQQLKQEIAATAERFIGLIKDQTLKENKTSIVTNVEQQTVNELANLGTRMNNDPLIQDEGMGSIGLIVILMKTVLHQRDKINALAYEIHKLKTPESSKEPETK